MKHEGYRFEIDEVAWPNTGGHSKLDRVERLVPDLMAGKFLLSPVVWHEVHGAASWTMSDDQVEFGTAMDKDEPIKREDETGKTYDLTRDFFEEVLLFPFGSHDDLLDACSRIYDMEPGAPADMFNTRLPEVDSKWVV